MLTKRQIHIIKLFGFKNIILNSTQIADEIIISERTVRIEIKEINKVQNFIEISSKGSKGYALNIKCYVKYNEFISNTGNTVPANYCDERILSIIEILLTNNKYIKVEDLADQV